VFLARRVQVIGSRTRAMLVLLATIGVALGAAQQTRATSLAPGDVVIYRVGSGGTEALTSSATSTFLDEFAPSGSLDATLAFPTTTAGSNKALVASGSASSEGLLTLSANGEYLMATGYNAPLGTASIGETKATAFPRTIGRVSGAGVINTETALTDFADKNNARSAVSSDGLKIWVGGGAGGVRFTELKKTTSTTLQSLVTNVRQLAIFNKQLYASADPEKNGASGFTIATVGSGLPSTSPQTIASLPFETAPEQPYAYSLLALGLGPAPDTIYVADNKLGGVTKYSLQGGKWVRRGTVEIPSVTGVTANDVNGVVTIYATSGGKNGVLGSLYKLSDVSGVNGTLGGVPVEIATAPANEAFRGVAFAPGTVIGSGGTPPSAPTIGAAENTLAAAFEDPTNQSLPLTIGDSNYSPSELTVTVRSSNPTVAPTSGITVTGGGASRTLSVTPAAVGTSQLTLTVEAPDGSFASTQVNYGASAYQGNTSDRYYAGAGNASTAIDVGGGYMIVGDDESNVLHLYQERTSGKPVKSFDFTNQLPDKATEIDIEASARAGNTLYWMGSMSNKHNGELQPNRDIVFAATITGSGASTELTYLDSYTELRDDLINWDNANGSPLGFAKSAEFGSPSDLPTGFNVEGFEFAAGSSTEAYVAFRAPLEPPGEERHLAVLVPVTNFSSLVNGSSKATFGTALQWNLGGLAIREIRRNADGEFLVIAGSADESNSSFGLYGWDGEAEDEPVLLNGPFNLAAEGAWEDITSTPDPIANGDQAELLEDNGDSEWYKNGKTSKNGLLAGLQKDLGRLFTIQIPLPGTPGTPHLQSGPTPNSGQFTLRWKPAPTLRARFTLQHQDAKGGWSTVASGLTHGEHSFTSGSPEGEGTWTYRVIESNETGESAPSSASAEIKVDRTPPNAPTASADRPPDYSGGGGWYRDSVTVSFTGNGDPTLADGSLPSGVDPATLTAPQSFTTSGSHTASGTVADQVGNASAPGTLVAQVDATAPELAVECPASALVGESGVEAKVTASDGESGLASDPSGTVPIETGSAGEKTVMRTAIDNVGHETTRSCTTVVGYPTPGAPTLSAGTNPNANGLFTIAWTGADPLQYFGLSYTLQAHNASTATWSTVATSIGALSYEFSGAGEAEGTWVYRVQGSDTTHGQTTEYSPGSASIVVDKTTPFPPSAAAAREPDFAGGGGWYRDSVEVDFTSNGDRPLSDGSPGSGVNPASIPSPQVFSTSGSHNACSTVTDNVGHVSGSGCLLAVQVDATAPKLEVECPAIAARGQAGVTATVTASDAESGLAADPSESVPIDTTQAGPVATSRTAIDNVGHETTKSCTTEVVPPPGVAKVAPAKGPATGGTVVKISGNGFTGATAVKFGSVSAASFMVTSATTITAVTPAETGATVHVGVTVRGVTNAPSTTDHFKFVPVVSGLTPSSGPRAGKTSVTVRGAGFAVGKTDTAIVFGSSKALSVNCSSFTECVATSPTHAIGTVNVKATVNKATSLKVEADRYTYE
jgi:hypothetical protein